MTEQERKKAEPRRALAENLSTSFWGFAGPLRSFNANGILRHVGQVGLVCPGTPGGAVSIQAWVDNPETYPSGKTCIVDCVVSVTQFLSARAGVMPENVMPKAVQEWNLANLLAMSKKP